MRILKPGLRMAMFGARLLIAFAVPPLVFGAFAHEAHPTAQPATATAVDEAPFLKENDDAMTRMMNGMAIKPTGDIDHDFVAMMSPHHQGAIDMAMSELRYGKNEQLRRIAQEIIVDQMQEIAAMKLAIGEPATDSTPAPTQRQPARPRSSITIRACKWTCPWNEPLGAPHDDLEEHLLAGTILATATVAWAGQAPGALSAPMLRSATTTASTRPSNSPTRCR